MEKTINNQTSIIPKERNYWLDNTKFLLILLVVIGHFISGFKKYESINCLYYFIFLFHMPLFIFITGYFSKNIIKKNKSKILNFIVLYVIMQIIEIIITKGAVTFIKPRYALWYLQSIIIYNLLLPVIDKIKPIAMCVIAIMIGLLIGFDNNVTTIASLSRTFVMLPFFVIGYFTNEEKLNKLKNKKYIILAILFLILISIFIPTLLNQPIKIPKELLWGSTSYDKMGMGNIGILYRGVWYILTILTSLAILTLVPKSKVKLVSKLGSRTLQVYCLHIVAVLLFKQTQLYKGIDTRLELILLIIGATILTFILSLKIFSYPFDFIMKRKWKLIMKEDN